jgi:hypothetical protein
MASDRVSTAIAGLTETLTTHYMDGETLSDIRVVLEEIERLNRALKESYRIGADGWEEASKHAEKVRKILAVLEQE